MRVASSAGLVGLLVACNGPGPQSSPGVEGAAQHVGAMPGVSSPDSEPPPDAQSASSPDSDLPDAAPDGAGDAAAPPVQARDGSRGVGLDATTLDAAGPDPTPRGCSTGGDGGSCPLPASVCADSRWLVYYDNGQCVSGQCTWDERYVDCGTIGCTFGACQYPPTAQAAP